MYSIEGHEAWPYKKHRVKVHTTKYITVEEHEAIVREIKKELEGIINWRTDAPYKSTIDPEDWDKFWQKRGVK